MYDGAYVLPILYSCHLWRVPTKIFHHKYFWIYFVHETLVDWIKSCLSWIRNNKKQFIQKKTESNDRETCDRGTGVECKSYWCEVKINKWICRCQSRKELRKGQKEKKIPQEINLYSAKTDLLNVNGTIRSSFDAYWHSIMIMSAKMKRGEGVNAL